MATREGVALHFEHKLSTADFDRRELVFLTASGSERVDFDFCIGADGSYSNVRRQMMRFVRWARPSVAPWKID